MDGSGGEELLSSTLDDFQADPRFKGEKGTQIVYADKVTKEEENADGEIEPNMSHI